MDSFRELSRRRVLSGVGALGGGFALAGMVGGESTPPPEAYQPAATKNWWYFNGHLYDPDDTSEPLYDFMGAYVMEHGGDTAGHYQLFTFVGNDGDGGGGGDRTDDAGSPGGSDDPEERGSDPDDARFAESTPGVIRPSTENYAARFTGAEASGFAVRIDDERPERWHVNMDPAAPVGVDLRYTSTYVPRRHENYQEGGGFANVIYWNQATLDGRITTTEGDRPVVGVGFLEHVWGTWSRVPQMGVDYLNVHLGTATRPRAGGHRERRNDPPGKGLPTWGSVYCRRTFYHGTPRDPESDDGDPVHEDIGPDLYLTTDGETWYEATDLAVYVTEPDGERVELSEHRQGRPEAVDVHASFEEDGDLSLHLDALPDVTIPNPHEEFSLGNVHEGAATVDGEVRVPGEDRTRRVSGVAQTEHQRYGPQYPY